MTIYHADNIETAIAVVTVNIKDVKLLAGHTSNLRIIGTGSAATTIKNTGIKTLEANRLILASCSITLDASVFKRQVIMRISTDFEA